MKAIREHEQKINYLMQRVMVLEKRIIQLENNKKEM